MAEVKSTTVAQPPPTTSPAVTPGVAVAEIMDPLTGELVGTDNVDGLIDLLEALKDADKKIYAAKLDIQRALAARCPREKKTERVAGHRRVVKVDHPSTTWENSRLKEAWFAYPQFREEYLTIREIAPKLVEVKKLKGTTGPADLETFKKIVLSAEREPTGNPTVTIEK